MSIKFFNLDPNPSPSLSAFTSAKYDINLAEVYHLFVATECSPDWIEISLTLVVMQTVWSWALTALDAPDNVDMFHSWPGANHRKHCSYLEICHDIANCNQF